MSVIDLRALTLLLRTLRQWNLDIIGVSGIEAEAELLAALVTFFKAAGLGPQDVGIKVQFDIHQTYMPLTILCAPRTFERSVV